MKRQGKSIFTSSVHLLVHILLPDRVREADTQDRVEEAENRVVVHDGKVARYHRMGRAEAAGSRQHTDRRNVREEEEDRDNHPWDGEVAIGIALCRRNSLGAGFGYDIHRVGLREEGYILWEEGHDDHSHRKVARRMGVVRDFWTVHGPLKELHSVSVKSVSFQVQHAV